MNWIPLDDETQLIEIINRSNDKPQLIFKHSTRCSVSSMAKKRLERDDQPENIDFYFLDLIKHRSLSNKIASDFKIRHQSPQVILIKNGQPVYNESHSGILMEDIVSNASD